MKQQALAVPATTEPTVVIEPAVTSSVFVLFERMAMTPGASVEMLERMMALWERAETRKAETAFNAAMATAQKAMRPVAADADNPQTHSKYASYAALDRALRPIYTDHGFGLSFNTEDAGDALVVKLACIVSHSDGFSRMYRIEMPADGKGAKGGDVMTRTHATGSAVSYGMRYLLKMIFNVAIGREAKGQPFADDDGNGAGGRQAPPEPTKPAKPEGFDAWWGQAQFEADNHGIDALTTFWKAAPDGMRPYVNAVERAKWESLKKDAEKVSEAERVEREGQAK